MISPTIVYPDSSSVLTSLRSFKSKSRQDILFEEHQSVTRIVNQGKVYMGDRTCRDKGE